MMEQGEHEGNIYETHHQPDLTPEVLKKRYPKLKRAFENEYYGYMFITILMVSTTKPIFCMQIVHTMIQCVQL